MGKLATIDIICGSFRPWPSCEDIYLLNIPPNWRYRQLSAGHPSYGNRQTIQGTFIPCNACILWYPTASTSSRKVRDTTKSSSWPAFNLLRRERDKTIWQVFINQLLRDLKGIEQEVSDRLGSVLKVEMVVSSNGTTNDKTSAYGRYGVTYLHI
jgi:hypothetical protein